MMHRSCQKEPAVVAALQTGTLPAELLAHVAECDVCAEVMLVIHSLQQEMVTASHQHPPDAGLVWRRIQETARRKALAKATAPIRIAGVLAFLAAVIAVPWLLSSLNAPAWFSSSKFQDFAMLDRAFSEALTRATLFGGIAALVCISFSSWYLLRQE